MNIKAITFRLGAVLLPIVLLLVLEGILRMAGVGRDSRTPFQPVPGQPDYLALSPEFVKKYFTGFQPGVAFDPFTSQKSDSVLRVFALGGSSTAGYPYNFYYGFPARLQARLESLAPDRRIEVVNLGLTAVNSFTIWDMRDAILEHKPDAVVIYSGHNEYYGAFGAGSTIYQLGNRVWMKRLVIRLKGTALFSGIERLLAGRQESDLRTSEDRTMMARVIGNRTIKLGDEVFEAGIDQFRENMTATLDAISGRGIPVYIGTLVSNLADQPPLGDDPDAAAEYERGRALFEQGDAASARQAFVAAKERDDIRFRAPEGLNETIRSLAQRENVYVVDIGQPFRQASSSGIEDNSLFDDHLHPNYTGYDLIAERFYQAIVTSPHFRHLHRSVPPDDYSIDPFERTAVTAQLIRLKSGYPFVKGRTAEEEAAAYRAALDRLFYRGSYVDSLAVLSVAELKPTYEALHEAVRTARSEGDTLAALLMYRSLLYWQPFNAGLMQDAVAFGAGNARYVNEVAPLARFSLNRTRDLYHANVLASNRIRQGRYEDAEILLRDIEDRDPSSKPMLFNRARLFVLQGDTVAARRYYERYTGARPSPTGTTAPATEARVLISRAFDALQRKQYRLGLALADSAAIVQPDLADAAFIRGRILFEMDRLDDAASAYNQVIAVDEDYPGVWHNLGNTHFQSKKYKDAVAAYLHEARARPTAQAWHAVGGAYWQLGLNDSSRIAYEQAATLDASYAPVNQSLADWYEANGDYSEALRYARKAAEIDSSNLDYRYRIGVLLLRTGNPELAVEPLRRVVRTRPWDFGALYNLGQSLQQLGRREEAAAVLSRARETQEQQREVNRLASAARDRPDSFDTRLAYADALRKSGRLNDAIGQYLIAEAMRPNNLSLRSNVATAFLQAGDTTQALARYRSVLAEDSTVVETWLNLYVYYAQTGQTDKARAALERALRIDPDHPMIKRLRGAS